MGFVTAGYDAHSTSTVDRSALLTEVTCAEDSKLADD